MNIRKRIDIQSVNLMHLITFDTNVDIRNGWTFRSSMIRKYYDMFPVSVIIHLLGQLKLNIFRMLSRGLEALAEDW
jgi:hypothetical protein